MFPLSPLGPPQAHPLHHLEDNWPRALELIQRHVPSEVYEHDIYRTKYNFYGQALFTLVPGSVVLDVGGRSGIFALHCAMKDESLRVFVVEGDSKLRTTLSQTIQDIGITNVFVFSSLEEAQREIKHTGADEISLVKFDRSTFQFETVRDLLSTIRVTHICGEFDEDRGVPIHLYRICSRNTDSFYWHNATQRSVLAGDRWQGVEISLVVPAYRVEQYLDQCLDSLVRQTLHSKEIIVVDDGSTGDATAEIANSWARRYPDIVRVIHKENGGCASARSAGLEAATGRYVGFVDSDDWVEPVMFERLYEAAVLEQAEISQCGFRKVYETDGTFEDIPGCFALDNVKTGRVPCVADLLMLQPSIWRRLYRTDFLRANGLDFAHHIKRFDDLPFQFMTFAFASRVAVIPEVYYHYRLGRKGQDVAITDHRLFVHFDIFDLLKQELRTNGSYALEYALRRVQIATHLWALNRIDKPLRWKYFAAMANDLFDGACYVPAFGTVAAARQRSNWALLLVISACVRSFCRFGRKSPPSKQAAVSSPGPGAETQASSQKVQVTDNSHLVFHKDFQQQQTMEQDVNTLQARLTNSRG